MTTDSPENTKPRYQIRSIQGVTQVHISLYTILQIYLWIFNEDNFFGLTARVLYFRMLIILNNIYLFKTNVRCIKSLTFFITVTVTLAVTAKSFYVTVRMNHRRSRRRPWPKDFPGARTDCAYWDGSGGHCRLCTRSLGSWSEQWV